MEEEFAVLQEGADAAGVEQVREEDFTPEEIAAFEESDLRHALALLFEAVRICSADGRLSAPDEWEEAGVVPPHLSAEDFEMYVYDYLEERSASPKDEASAEEPATTYRTATRAVGVPQPIAAASCERAAGEDGEDAPESEDGEDSVRFDEAGAESRGGGLDGDLGGRGECEHGESDCSGDSGDEFGFDVPEGFELVELEGELTLVPIEGADETDEIACDDMAVLVGKRSYYLYSRDVMTDRYAHWAFLAREDDRIVTFVECVRDESRTYPRPMSIDGLKNEPFSMTDEEIVETWEAIKESGAYPDIETTAASNGDVFFYSTEYLNPAYAASLAEWHAVERGMYL